MKLPSLTGMVMTGAIAIAAVLLARKFFPNLGV